jgi:hypothetical protein
MKAGLLYVGLFDGYSERRRSFSQDQKLEMLERQNYRCAYCFKSINIKNSHADHIYPFSAGGDTSVGNGQMVCNRCHRIKTANQQPLYYPNPKSFYGAKKSAKNPSHDSLDELFGLGSNSFRKSKSVSNNFCFGLDDMLGFGSSSSHKRRKSSVFDELFGLG